MKREVSAFVGKPYDVLVVGGGIQGALAACECARAGLKTALFEKDDFGHATSANSLKVLHGGLRYLQHLNVKRMRHSIASRRIMMEHAPHCVRPLRCLIPNHGKGVHGNFLMRIALFVNDLIGWDRNRGIVKGSVLPPGRILSRKQLLALFPDIVKEETTGASVWYDGLAVNSERLTLAFVQEAVEYGANVANYTEINKLQQIGEGVHEVGVSDRLSGEPFRVQARCVVNACGSWGGEILGASGGSVLPVTSWAKAVNIVVRKNLFPEYAVGLKGDAHFTDKDSIIKKKGRFFFFVPWRGYTMIGTTYKMYTGSSDEVCADYNDVDEMIRMVNEIYPSAKLEPGDVSFAHAGLVPMSAKSAEHEFDVQLEKESLLIDHGTSNSSMAGVYSIKGVKYTTAPQVASELLLKICSFLKVNPCSRDGKEKKERLSESSSYLKSRYGERADIVQFYVDKNDKCIAQDPVFTLGEVQYMIEEEMACKLSDVIFRRSELGTAEAPPCTTLDEIASFMAELLQWDSSRKNTEIKEVLAVFTSWKKR